MRHFSLCLLAFLIVIFNSCQKTSTNDFDFSRYYDQPPDIESCKEGVLKNEIKYEALNHLNYIRSLHKLPPVSYNFQDDMYMQKAALISAANGKNSHQPDQNSECFTTEGSYGCYKSNLGIKSMTEFEETSPSTHIEQWLTEANSSSIGHRRWMLNPFLKYISYGRIDGLSKKSDFPFVTTSALKVINDETADISGIDIEFIGYPYGRYPAHLFPKDLYLSFSILLDKERYTNNKDVDYTNATIQVTNNSGQQMQVHSVQYDNINYGIANSIQWKINNLEDNMAYTVKVTHVLVSGVIKNYQYEFTLTK